jgi:uncharacterized membrane protein
MKNMTKCAKTHLIHDTILMLSILAIVAIVHFNLLGSIDFSSLQLHRLITLIGGLTPVKFSNSVYMIVFVLVLLCILLTIHEGFIRKALLLHYKSLRAARNI